ncbi:MAG: cupredoxin domain-containing protein [Actinomycetota bacterium]|nr:cupredoxin domain-containing protein [Actinomycetota bacterium]
MADPEQIYAEVLAEEQGKGVTPAVAEARAKAARARAEEGSPHPKEPKWWPGSQPHFEGGGGGEEAAAEEEEPAAEEATADVQADEVEPDAPAVTPVPATEDPVAPAAAGATAPATPPAPAPQAVPQEPAAAVGQPASPAPQPVAAQPAAAATATQVVVPQTTGVTHGTTTGTRLRPEDEVATEAQFEGQRAMYERRKLIDELVATGVPAVSAEDTDRSRSPWLAVLYLLIPLLVVLYLAGQEEGTEAAAPTEEVTSEAPAKGGGGTTTELVAADIQWENTDTLELTADEPNPLDLVNEDATVHNMSIYKTREDAETGQNPLFKGDDAAGGQTVSYEIDPLKKGTYTFVCDYHVNMIGDVNAQ